MKKISFALCPHCFWLATCFKRIGKNCPRCNKKISIQTVNVAQRICNERTGDIVLLASRIPNPKNVKRNDVRQIRFARNIH